jgi:hypothetical protein
LKEERGAARPGVRHLAAEQQIDAVVSADRSGRGVGDGTIRRCRDSLALTSGSESVVENLAGVLPYKAAQVSGKPAISPFAKKPGR